MEQNTTNGVPEKPAAQKPSTALAPVEHGAAISAFASGANFENAQRMAVALSKSSLVPPAYQNNVPNCLIALETASRVNASVLMVCQNLDIIHNRGAWRSTFLIATVNASGKFSPLRYRFEGKPGTDDWGCRAYAKDLSTGEECVGTLITIGLAKAEGWFSKSGSKWRTMPEQMLCYRAAAFWTRIYSPELSLGMQTTEEAIDTTGYTVTDTTQIYQPSAKSLGASAKELEAMLRDNPPVPEAEVVTEAKAETEDKPTANAQAAFIDDDGVVHDAPKGKK